MKPLRAVLFDLDNTLFHWDPCDERGRKAAHAVLRQQVDVSFEQFMELHDAARDFLKKQLHGQAANHNRVLFFKHIVDQLSPRPRPELVLAMHASYWQAFFSEIQPHPDAIRVLTQLKVSYKLGLVSNHVTQPQLEKIIRLGLAPFFDVVITSEEAGVEKPNAQIYQLALSGLGVSADETAMIGDHPRGDVQGAHLAGMRAIYMAEYTPDVPPPECADFVARHLADVLTFVAGNA